ncbi:MAG: hypothetical protein IPJ51_05000 [Saprospiraceae bacterium]|nr:hypothetical protein [Saprospiraceae bacterium]
MIKSIHDRRELQTRPALSRRMTVQRDEAGFLKYRIAVTNFDNTFASVASEAEDVTCTLCKFDVIAGDVRYEFKSYIQTTVNNIANGSIKNQHRAYIETGTLVNTRYIFEKLKLNPPFIVQTPQGPVTLTGNNAAELYVRSKFLEMYQTNASYFWNNSSTTGWWQSVSGINFADEDALLTWLNTQTYDSAWLNFIKVQ